MEKAFHELNLCPKEDNQQTLDGTKETRRTSKSKLVSSNSDTSDDNEVNSRFRTSVEERDFGTIPGSAIVTHVALSHSTAQANLQRLKSYHSHR